ncbi:NADH-quinone oxidoreductase subunit E [Litoreibacter arenae]|uniref:NADH-ubiquinone oxidoreductase chain E n=1 Tax=Litoreibacter arenae DSM 19593 TaxID=1123360 RepID=S9RPB3_9RHOB|nr:NADH-quinone oxidoreductase subunit E [Litoreibacter arenae]EPX79925.1 NADH-ubiquinone oxidoreductase chain E [Litoreibacter arenae DSM 19593]
MLRRLHADQPDSFAFTSANQAWAEAQITKYPEGRQASAIIPLLWRAQEQEGWLSRPAIEHVAEMLGMAYIRALEVATFYFMFQLQPVGSVAHIQICGTTSCMICGAEDLIGVCKEKIAPKPHQLSADGKFSWEEVECLGACANAPMAQIGKDYYEDLTAKRMGEIIDGLANGQVPTPGPQNGRYAAEPLKGLTSLTEYDSGKTQYNASVQLATDLGDTIKRIDGTEVPLLTPWQHGGKEKSGKSVPSKPKEAELKQNAREVDETKDEVDAKKVARPKTGKVAPKSETGGKATDGEFNPTPKTAAKPVAADGKPEMLTQARDGGPDDLKMIKGVGPKLEQLLHKLGVFHFDQIASWRKKEVAWVDENLEGFKGRVSRDEWVKQAKVLAKGGTTEFSGRVKKGGVY